MQGIAKTVGLLLLALSLMTATSHAEPVIVPGADRLMEHDAQLAGQILLSELNCTSCHVAPDSTGTELAPRKAPRLDATLKAAWVRAYLRNPSELKPGGLMPDVLAIVPEPERDRAADALAAYIISEAKQAGDPTEPQSEHQEYGHELFHSIGCVACHEPDPHSDSAENQTIVSTEPLTIPSVPLTNLAAKYHGPNLAKFLLDPRAKNPSGRMPDFLLAPEEAAALSDWLMQRDSNEPPALEFDVTDAELIAEGRVVFEKLNCAACHVVDSPPPATQAKPLAELADATGCLDTASTAPHPRYDLSDAQRAAIASALTSLNETNWSNAPASIHRRLGAMNCYACHSRGDVGGPEPGRAAYFPIISEEFDLGDEGRLPPPLTQAGAKLKTTAMHAILDGEGAVRPYMLTRMPRFGELRRGLPELFEHADLDASKPEHEIIGRNMYGRQLIGEEGMRCINCHAFRGHPSRGIPGLDLAHTFERLRPEWFREFLLDPASKRKGTRMPAFWDEGKSDIKKILGGDATKQIDALWVYLMESDQTRLPAGLENTDEYELKPGDRPILLRTFMKDVGTHVITVGFGEGLNFAFDGLRSRFARAWTGPYIDAEAVWDNRFTPLSEPLGEPLDLFPDAPLLTRPSAESATYQMKGYRLDAGGVPTFLYAFDGVDVDDRITPTSDYSFVRMLRLNGDLEGLSLLIAKGEESAAQDTGTFEIDGIRWRVHSPANVSPTLNENKLTMDLGDLEAPLEIKLEVSW